MYMQSNMLLKVYHASELAIQSMEQQALSPKLRSVLQLMQLVRLVTAPARIVRGISKKVEARR